MHVGELIHTARKTKKMTLSELSSSSGVALATLSRIENGKMTGTIASHMRICKALEISLPDLYKDLVTSEKTVEYGKKKPADVFMHSKKAAFEILVSNAMSKKMMPAMIRMLKGCSTSEEESKPGSEKFLFIVDGKVEIVIGGTAYKLSKGDTMYFDASISHNFRNISESNAALLSVICPPAV